MSEEEKKAIEWFKSDLEVTKELGKRWGFQEKIKNDEIILNLVERQQKEIEELKEKDKEKKAISQAIIRDTFIDRYISKDKIKEKIKELEKEIHVVMPNEYNKMEQIIEFKNEGALNVLQELLEEN